MVDDLEARPLLELDVPEARELAEVLLLATDLTESFNSLRLWHANYARAELSNVESLLAAGLFARGIMLFTRCFGEKPPKLQKDIFAAQAGGIEMFDWAQTMRDAFVAHSFGPARQCVVGVFAIPGADGALTYSGVGEFFLDKMTPSAHGGRDLVEMANAARNVAVDRSLALRQTVAAIAQQMGGHELAKLRPARVYGVDDTDLRTEREKYREKRARPQK